MSKKGFFMTKTKHAAAKPKPSIKTIVATGCFGLGLLAASYALAGQDEAREQISRASAKIEMVTRQAGQAGDKGDQSFNLARQKLDDAKAAEAKGQHDAAMRLAEQASLLAALTAEKATLASLQTQHDNLVTAAQTSN
jgi:hypothetical protein